MINLSYKLKIFDKNNKKVYESKKRKARSFVKAFPELLCVQLAHRAEAIRDITNTIRTISPHISNFWTTVEAGDLRGGIVVGSGTTPVTTSDHRLATIIPHGNAAGQLHYDTSIISPTSTIALRSFFSILRNIRNDTLTNININEVGIYTFGMEGATGHTFLIIRDVIPTRIITPGQTLLFSYEISFDL